MSGGRRPSACRGKLPDQRNAMSHHPLGLTRLDVLLLVCALGLAILCAWLVLSDYGAQREFFGGLFYALLLAEPPPEARRYEQVRLTMTRAQVRELLGEPTKVGAGGAPYHHYGLGVEGASDRPTWVAPPGGVFAYVNHDRTAGCYIFFNEAGRVKQVRVFVKD